MVFEALACRFGSHSSSLNPLGTKATSSELLGRLDELTRSENEGIALRAIKTKLSMGSSLRPSLPMAPSPVGASIEGIQQALEARLSDLTEAEEPRPA
jgi:hypothetical protein